jgi:chromate transporter
MIALLADLFLQFSLLACVAFGGATALLPEIQRLVVEQRHWMDETTFSQLFAIAQAAPGPNLLVITLIGWKVAGLAGAIVATIAFCLPMSLAIFLLFRHWQRFKDAPWRAAIQTGVAPLAVGLVAASGCLIGVSAGLAWGGVVCVGLTVLVTTKSNLHPLWLIGSGAAAGAIGWV